MRVTPASCVPGIEWPGLVTAAGASILALQWQFERSQGWAPERLLELQFRQIRALAAHCVSNVPHYRDALRAAGLTQVSELNPESFRRWPILRKSQVRANEAALRAMRVPAEHGATSETWTTGSTGAPIRVFHTQLEQTFAQALFVRDHLWHGRDFSQRFAVILPMAKPGSQAGWGAPGAAFGTGPASLLSSTTDIDAQLEWLFAEQPAYLLSLATNLRALLLRSRESGRSPRTVRQLVSTGEMPAPDLRQLARECWDASVAVTYSCEEFATVASQCPGSEHYHVHAENVYVEVLREDGSPCAPGEVGRVVITPLHNFAMPLMRYEIGDYAQPGGSCESGRGLPVLDRVVGRVRNMARDPDGRRFWPSFPAELWLSVAPIRRLQLVQHSLREIEVRYVLERELTAGEAGALKSALQARLGYAFEIGFSRVGEIARAPGGKFEDFISLIEP
jgi:phenylacetate-CoA ligase